MMTAVIILYLSDQLTVFWWSLSSGSLCERVKHVAAPPTWTQTRLMDGASSVASFGLNYRLPARGGWFYPAGRLQDALTALITPSDGWKGRCCNVPPDTLFTDKLKRFAVWNAALWLASLQITLRPPSARQKGKNKEVVSVLRPLLDLVCKHLGLCWTRTWAVIEFFPLSYFEFQKSCLSRPNIFYIFIRMKNPSSPVKGHLKADEGLFSSVCDIMW